jgi:hypothetical protein
MRIIEVKSSVVLKRWTPAIEWIFYCLNTAQNTFDFIPTLVITSINDGNHIIGSRHYTDEAVDVRSKNFLNIESKVKFMNSLLIILNSSPKVIKEDSFTILLEDERTDNEHFHIQVSKGKTYP